ncbi:MAG: hypothetical protein ACTSQO_13445 [Candidatus Helarchaeota archaeon]
MSYSETHPKKATFYLLIGLIFETVFPVLILIYMDQILSYFASMVGIPPFSITTNDMLLVYTIIFGLIFSFIAFGRGYFTKHSKKYAIFDCIGSIFSFIGYIIIVGFFSGAYFGHIYFSIMNASIDINIYMIYSITLILYLITFIIKFAAIFEAKE